MDSRVQQFGRVEFDRKHRKLSVAGRPVELDRSSAAILSTLLDAAGNDVSKDRLLELGWPDRVVHENSLAKAIGRLRQALGEDGDALETIHGYGYRLDAEVRSTVPATPHAPHPVARFRRASAPLSTIALVLFAVASVAALSGDAQSERAGRIINGEAPDSIGRVLWVDDHPKNNVTETRFLGGRKVAVYQVSNSQDALALLAMYDYDAVISDMGRNEKPLAGIDMVKTMRARGDRTPFILYTVYSSDAQRRLIIQAGGQGVAEKRDELYAAILPLVEDAGHTSAGGT